MPEEYSPRTGKKLESLIENKVREVTGQTMNPYKGGVKNGVVRWRWLIPVLIALAGAIGGIGVVAIGADDTAKETRETLEWTIKAKTYPLVNGTRLEVQYDNMKDDIKEKADIKDIKAMIVKLSRQRRR